MQGLSTRSGWDRWPWARGALLAGLALAFVGLAMFALRGDLGATWSALAGADLPWLAVAAVALVAWSLAWSALLAGCRRVAGLDCAGIVYLLPVSNASVALNLLTKSGGLAGLSIWLRDGRRRGEAPGTVTAAYLLGAALTEVAFTVTLLAALVLVTADGTLTRTEVLASLVFLAYATVRLGLLVVAGRSREQLRRLWALPGQLRARVLRRPMPPPVTTTPDELCDAVQLAVARPRLVLAPLLAGTAVDLFGVVMLWACLGSVTGSSQLSTAFVAYGVSSLFGIVGFLPGGIGFVEVGAIALLTGAGVAVPAATAATVLYRVFDLYLPVAVGGVSGLWLRRRR